MDQLSLALRWRRRATSESPHSLRKALFWATPQSRHQKCSRLDVRSIDKNSACADKCTVSFTSLWVLSENGAPRRAGNKGQPRDNSRPGVPHLISANRSKITPRFNLPLPL